MHTLTLLGFFCLATVAYCTPWELKFTGRICCVDFDPALQRNQKLAKEALEDENQKLKRQVSALYFKAFCRGVNCDECSNTKIKHPKAVSKFDGGHVGEEQEIQGTPNRNETKTNDEDGNSGRSRRSPGCIPPKSGTVQLMDTWVFGQIDGKVLKEVKIMNGGQYEIDWKGDRLMKLRPKLRISADCEQYTSEEVVKNLPGDVEDQTVDISLKKKN
ncbi:hypothetical protein FO519_005875 [Halicephalobus sp. NKZ332]|nr:hypothetical protein FO519_005875 [Halicephalobus sp. NKZ332]